MRLDRPAAAASASGGAARSAGGARRLLPMWVLVLAVIMGLSACGGSDATEADLERLELAFESADVTLGSEVFGDSCSVCHGSDGSGGVGAALGGVDERLTIRDHLAVVWTGRGSMPPFGGILTDAEIAAVVAYQRSTFGDER
ncbi:c-type cytochrome [Candidatus Poriferisodalis sp.]|uniref:c-type cytochrome n=1 Tax=Candidatus Poriferisodalis sp. TaxID=3101277 RepID=UPI003B022798